MFLHVSHIKLSCMYGAVSSYPDSSLSMGSLSALEHAGIEIVKPLEEHLTELQSVTGITIPIPVRWRLPEWKQETGLMQLINRWGQGEGCLLLTWRSLLDKLQVMNLRYLSQQIDDYLRGKLLVYWEPLDCNCC